MKKLLINLIGLVALTTSIFAQGPLYVSGSAIAATNVAPISTPFILDQIILSTTNTAGGTLVRLYDGGLTVVNAAYTNYVTYTTNVVSTYISVLGTTNIMTNTVIWNALNPVAAATNANTVKAMLAVNPTTGNVIDHTFNPPLVFGKSLTLSNNLIGLNYIIRYHLP